MNDLIFQTTVSAARRLFKSRLRLALCRLKGSEPNGDVWQTVSLLEEGIEKEAQADWDEVRACWGITDVDKALLGIALQHAIREARKDVTRFFTGKQVDPAWVHQKLVEVL